jgi:proteasome lid subunit RPN8/RPN11
MKIIREVIEELLAISKDNYPLEFVALLRGKKGVIEEYIFLPGTEFGHTSAIFRIDMLPLGQKIHGTFHSHPSTNNHPSQQDLSMFASNGNYHIIAAYPYDMGSWRCYDKLGNEVRIEIIDE